MRLICVYFRVFLIAPTSFCRLPLAPSHPAMNSLRPAHSTRSTYVVDLTRPTSHQKQQQRLEQVKQEVETALSRLDPNGMEA
jgi:hypothetical protein